MEGTHLESEEEKTLWPQSPIRPVYFGPYTPGHNRPLPWENNMIDDPSCWSRPRSLNEPEHGKSIPWLVLPYTLTNSSFLHVLHVLFYRRLGLLVGFPVGLDITV